MRAGSAQQDPDAVRTGRGEHRAFQCQAAQPLDQGIGQSRQQLPELVGPETMAGRPIGKEVQLLILEAVLHVPACAVHSVVEIVVGPRQVGDHEARIEAQGGIIRLSQSPGPTCAPNGIRINGKGF